MSGWCAGCHTVYMETGTPQVLTAYDAGDDWGYGAATVTR